MSDFMRWLDGESIALQSFVLISFIILSWTAFTLIVVKIGQIMKNKRQEKHAEKMKAIQVRNAVTTENYSNHPLTEKIVQLIYNDKELIKVKLSFYYITLYYPENEKKTDFYEWNFDSIPAGEYFEFAQAVTERLGNHYRFEPSMNDTSGIITVIKGE